MIEGRRNSFDWLIQFSELKIEWGIDAFHCKHVITCFIKKYVGSGTVEQG